MVYKKTPASAGAKATRDDLSLRTRRSTKSRKEKGIDPIHCFLPDSPSTLQNDG
jgi:hypothetical protein